MAGFCAGLYTWPHRWLKSSEGSELRILWWALPFIVTFPLLIHARFSISTGQVVSHRVVGLWL